MLSWTSDTLSINPCALTGGCNNTHGCAESQRPAAVTFMEPSLCVVLGNDGSVVLTRQNVAQNSGSGPSYINL